MPNWPKHEFIPKITDGGVICEICNDSHAGHVIGRQSGDCSASRAGLEAHPTLEAIDQAGGISRAKAVIDVDHGHVAGATVEHSQQRGEALKACAVADAGGHSDYGRCDHTTDYAG